MLNCFVITETLTRYTAQYKINVHFCCYCLTIFELCGTVEVESNLHLLLSVGSADSVEGEVTNWL